MKTILFPFLLSMSTAFVNNGYGQIAISNDDELDMNAFVKHADFLAWLNRYDYYVKLGADSVRNYFGEHPNEVRADDNFLWFVIKDASGHHAVFGNLHGERFEERFQFMVDDNKGPLPFGKRVDDSLTTAVARTIRNANQLVQQLGVWPGLSYGLSFHPAVDILGDGQIKVWMFPAMSADSTAVTGIYGAYSFDGTGRELIGKEEYFGGALVIYKMNRENDIILYYPCDTQPSLDALHFLWFFTGLGPALSIEMKNALITINVSEDGLISWEIKNKSTGRGYLLSCL